jgi:hypothetical protein
MSLNRKSACVFFRFFFFFFSLLPVRYVLLGLRIGLVDTPVAFCFFFDILSLSFAFCFLIAFTLRSYRDKLLLLESSRFFHPFPHAEGKRKRGSKKDGKNISGTGVPVTKKKKPCDSSIYFPRREHSK